MENHLIRLYVNGDGRRARALEKSLRGLMDLNSDVHDLELEVVDIQKNFAMLEVDQILAIPTLIRKSPKPEKRIVGDIFDEAHVWNILTS